MNKNLRRQAARIAFILLGAILALSLFSCITVSPQLKASQTQLMRYLGDGFIYIDAQQILELAPGLMEAMELSPKDRDFLVTVLKNSRDVYLAFAEGQNDYVCLGWYPDCVVVPNMKKNLLPTGKPGVYQTTDGKLFVQSSGENRLAASSKADSIIFTPITYASAPDSQSVTIPKGSVLWMVLEKNSGKFFDLFFLQGSGKSLPLTKLDLRLVKSGVIWKLGFTAQLPSPESAQAFKNALKLEMGAWVKRYRVGGDRPLREILVFEQMGTQVKLLPLALDKNQITVMVKDMMKDKRP